MLGMGKNDSMKIQISEKDFVLPRNGLYKFCIITKFVHAGLSLTTAMLAKRSGLCRKELYSPSKKCAAHVSSQFRSQYSQQIFRNFHNYYLLVLQQQP